MIIWITLVLLLLNGKPNVAKILCKKYEVRGEYKSDSERAYCEDPDYYYLNNCQVPILYTYCVCQGSLGEKENNITSNFLGKHFWSYQNLLKKVYINDSFVNEIEVNAFGNLGNLSELYLQNNNISTIGKGVFNVLHNLTVLDISNNQVTIIENKSFYGLTNLKKLDISHNRIQNISPDIFDRSLTSMHVLDLSHNFISTIEFDAISKIFAYQYHYFNDRINAPYFYGDDLDDGYSKPSKPDDNNFNEVLTDSQLDLSFNKMKYFNFSRLNLIRLDLNNNNLDTLSDHLIKSKIIEKLDISNNHLTKFNYGIPDRLKYLNLSCNILQNLTISPSNGSKIETLDVSQNLITKLEPNVFTNMGNLADLYLKNNNLTELQIGIFKDLKNLKYLSLSGNHLGRFEFGTFSGLSGLLHLDISNNSFNNMNFKTFHILNNLTTLNIANNNLKTLDPIDILNHCENIKVIILNDNPWNCESLLNFTMVLKKSGVKIIEGSSINVKNHLGHACHEILTENPDNKNKIDNHIIKYEVDDLKNFFESEFRNSNFYKHFNKNMSIHFPIKYDETIHNLTDTLKLVNQQLSNLNQTNMITSELLNSTTNFENKFTGLNLQLP